MRKKFSYKLLILIMSTSVITIFAQEIKETDVFKVNPWLPTFGFENTSEFRFDMDDLVPGIENTSTFSLKLNPFESNPELGKDDPFSAYMKINNFKISANNEDSAIKINVDNIISQINIYDFFIKISIMSSFDFNKESLLSFAPITEFKHLYNLSSIDIVRTFLEKKTSKKMGAIGFGYKFSQLDFSLAVGATGTGNRNHNEKYSDSPHYNKIYKGMLYGLEAKWKPIKNILEKDIESVITEIPFELYFGISGAYGNELFNTSSITYVLNENSTNNDDLFKPTLSNAAILTSLGAEYKLGLTKINAKNTYLVLQAGADIGIDPFASDFSIFGHISNGNKSDIKDCPYKPETERLACSNPYDFSKSKSLGIAFSTGASIGFAWNKDEGESESWNESSKKSGIALGMNYGQNLYRSKDETKQLKIVSENAFQSLNVELSSYENNKNGLISGLGWMTSISVYDILRQKH